MIPKTLFLEIANHFGGSGTRILTLMEKLPKNNIALACLAGSITGEKAKALGYKTFIVGTKKYDPFIFSRLMKLIKKEEFEIIDSQNINSKIWAALVASFSKITFVSTVNSLYKNEFGSKIKSRLFHFIDLLTNYRLDLCIAVSATIKENLIISGVPEDKIDVIVNSINIESNEYELNFKQTIANLNLPYHSIIGVAIGRLVWVKGFDILIDAVKIVQSKKSNFVCLIVGEGPLLSELDDKISTLGLTNSIKLLGYQTLDEVYGLLNNADMFLMPSRSEGTPIALLEAAALSVPIIASAVGGIPDMVTNKEHALLVKAEDPVELSEAIIKLIKDPVLHKNLAYQAKLRIEKNYNPSVQIKRLKKSYLKAVRNNNN